MWLGSKNDGNEFHVIVDHMYWPYGADMTVAIDRLFTLYIWYTTMCLIQINYDVRTIICKFIHFKDHFSNITDI